MNQYIFFIEATEATENTEFMDGTTEQIIGAAIEVHKILGPGLLERIYEEAMCHEFDIRKIKYQRQHFINFVYKGHKIKGQRLDLIVEDEVIVEIKSLEKLPDVAIAQTLSYLKASRLKRGLIVNFGKKTLIDGIKRISL